jgi:hypothetical protein
MTVEQMQDKWLLAVQLNNERSVWLTHLMISHCYSQVKYSLVMLDTGNGRIWDRRANQLQLTEQRKGLTLVAIRESNA